MTKNELNAVYGVTFHNGYSIPGSHPVYNWVRSHWVNVGSLVITPYNLATRRIYGYYCRHIPHKFRDFHAVIDSRNAGYLNVRYYVYRHIRRVPKPGYSSGTSCGLSMRHSRSLYVSKRIFRTTSRKFHLA